MTTETTPTELTQAKEALAQALQISPDEIKTRQPEWLALMRQGVIVNLHLRRWRATTTLTPEHLGLAFEDEAEQQAFEKTMKLGQVYLLPEKYIAWLSRLDSKARKSPDKYAFVTYWGKFLTPQAYVEWKKESDAHRAEYFQIRDELYTNWQQVLFEVADAHRANARAAYRREQQHSQATGKVSQVVVKYTESQFVARYLDAIMDAIPSAQAVKDSFSFDVDLSFIPLPSMLADEQAKVEQALVETQAARERAYAESQMRAEVMATYKARVDELITDHLRRIVAQLNDTLYEAASDILETTKNNERLHPRSVVQLKNAIERVKALNVLDYDDIERMAGQAERLIDQPAESRTLAQVESKLRDIALVTRSTLVSLGERPTRGGREFEPVDIAPVENVRQARARLGLAEIEIAPSGRTARVGAE